MTSWPRFLGFMVLAVPLLAGAAGPEGTAGGEIISLDPVFVEASSDNPWRHFSIGGFEVISRCPDAFNLVYARALQTANAARAALLPADFWGRLATPMKIVLYDREPEPGPGFAGRSPIDLSWVGANGALLDAPSFEETHPALVGDGDAFINCGNYRGLLGGAAGFYVDPDSALLLRARVPQFPAWFEAGLEGAYGLFTNRVTGTTLAGQAYVLVPNAIWMSQEETVALRKNPKRAISQLPLAVLFTGVGPSAGGDPWNAQAALFCRWGLYRREADGRGHREAFLDFVRRSGREPVSEALFLACFGMGFAQAEKSMAAYLPAAVNETIRVPMDVPAPVPLDIRDAGPSVVARFIGTWGRLEAQTLGFRDEAYRRDCLAQAERLFERAAARRTSDPQFLAEFGLYAVQAGDETRAREALDSATRAGVVRPKAYLELARIRLRDALPFPEQGVGDLNPAEYAEIRRLIEDARRQMPALPGCALLLARLMEHAPERPTRKDLAVLRGALEQFPRDASLAYKVATLYRRFGYPEEARDVISRALALSEDAEASARLATLAGQEH